MAAYDSRAETRTHIHRVRDHLNVFVAAMLERGRVHDASKFSAIPGTTRTASAAWTCLIWWRCFAIGRRLRSAIRLTGLKSITLRGSTIFRRNSLRFLRIR